MSLYSTAKTIPIPTQTTFTTQHLIKGHKSVVILLLFADQKKKTAFIITFSIFMEQNSPSFIVILSMRYCTGRKITDYFSFSASGRNNES